MRLKYPVSAYVDHSAVSSWTAQCVPSLPEPGQHRSPPDGAATTRQLHRLVRLISWAMAENRDIPQQFHIGETPGWSVNRRINSSLPGYLMISSKTFTNDLSDLPSETLCSLGQLFAKVQDALKRVLMPSGFTSVATGTHRAIRSISMSSRYMGGLRSFSGRMIAIGCLKPLRTDRARRLPMGRR